jgi:hypothetical protein
LLPVVVAVVLKVPLFEVVAVVGQAVLFIALLLYPQEITRLLLVMVVLVQSVQVLHRMVPIRLRSV